MMGDVMENLIGLGVSLAYVLAVLGASSLAARRGASSEATRKLAHIALGGWWLIAARFFDSPLWAAALPAAFILVNAFAYRRRSCRSWDATTARTRRARCTTRCR